MSGGTLDDRYFSWLCEKIFDVKARRSSRTHWDLMRKLYCTEFAWYIPHDDNRAEDGRALRVQWVNEVEIAVDNNWLTMGCSFLEMLLGLSIRLEFEGEGTASEWFWHLLNNLELMGFHDRSHFDEREVEDCTHRVMFRGYSPDGKGGLFPLQHAEKDQREVEIWYQMHAYLLESS